MFKTLAVILLVLAFSVSVAAAVVFGQTVTPTSRPGTSVTPTEPVQETSGTVPTGAPNTGHGAY